MKNKTNTFLTSFAAAALFASGSASAQDVNSPEAGVAIADAELSPQIRYVLEQQESLGNQDAYVVVDKTNREIFIIEEGRITTRDPVLVGMEPGDNLPVVRGRFGTAAGRFYPEVWTDELAYKDYYRGTNILFNCNEENTRCAALHGFYTQVASERRIERYESETSADNAITNGCVNVEYGVQDRLIAIFQQRNSDGSQRQLIIPPSEDTSTQNTNRFLGYSPNF